MPLQLGLSSVSYICDFFSMVYNPQSGTLPFHRGEITMEPINPQILRVADNVLGPLTRYHRYEVNGLGNIPATGPCLLVLNHSFATYDGFLLAYHIYKKGGRLIKALGDDLIFKLPFLPDWADEIGIHRARPETGQSLLADGHLLGVAPGGMREALRPSTEKFQIRWHKRQGFARLAVETGVPVVLCACPAADEIFSLYSSYLTKLSYRYLKIPVPIVRGLGPSLIPRPIKLTHYLSKPFAPPVYDELTFDSSVNMFHRRLMLEMRKMLTDHKN